MVVIKTNMAAARALMAIVAALAAAALGAADRVIIMLLMMAFMLTAVSRLLVARICAAFFPRVLARFMDMAVPLVRAVEVGLLIASSRAAAVSSLVAVVIPTAGVLSAATWPAVVSTLSLTASLVAIAFANGTAIMASVPSAVASMVLMASVLSEGLLIASIAR